MMSKFSSAFCLLALMVFAGCGNTDQKNKEAVTSDLVNISATASGKKSDPSLQPKFLFETESHDFGRITQGEKVSYSFKFKNTGGTDLVISDAHGSCGCTIPKYPRDPIPADGSSVIDVTFDSDGKVGKVEKTIMISANTSPNTKILKISAIIDVPEEK